MALSTEEERILTEIASRFGQDDPTLADELATFGRRRRRRIRAIVLTVVGLLVVASVAGAAFITAPT